MWGQIITYGYNYIRHIPHWICLFPVSCLRWNDAWQITLEEDLKRNPLSLHVTLNPKCCHT